MHLGYRCRDSGACCSSGWPIPIEEVRASAVAGQVAGGRVAPLATPWLIEAPHAPQGVAGTLAFQPDGRCVFHRRPSTAAAGRGGCAIYAHRPSSCEHFPHVCAIDPRGVRVTLSHYCPTAAGMLFAGTEPARIVEGPPVLAGRIPEGLDARESLPPLAENGLRLMDWAEVTAWEEGAMARVAGLADDAGPPDFALFEAACDAVPAPFQWPRDPDGVAQAWHVHVAPAWRGMSVVVGRYLASKVFASWALYSGTGLLEVMRGAAIARAVLGVEAARQCLRAGGPLDRALLKDAIRQSDLLLVHYADPWTLHGLPV